MGGCEREKWGVSEETGQAGRGDRGGRPQGAALACIKAGALVRAEEANGHDLIGTDAAVLVHEDDAA